VSHTQQAAAPMPSEDAYAVVHQRVYAPVFRDKVASLGIPVQSDAELAKMIVMAGQLRDAYEINRQKQAASQGSLLDVAQVNLNRELEKRGFASRPNPQDDLMRKQACANGARDPQLAHAILSLQHANTTNAAA
jgi:hypothetical protein